MKFQQKKIKTLNADIIIDTSHYATTSILNNNKRTQSIYQVTCIYEITIKSMKKLGFAIMDGPYFSILPSGRNQNKHLLYDVEYSIIQQKKSHKLPEKFLNFENYKKK